MGSKPEIAPWLRKNGPSTTEDSPFTNLKTWSSRRAGIVKFHPTQPPLSNRSAGGGPSTAIYYLPDDHSHDEVVEAFFEANPAWEELPKKALTARFPPEFREAIYRYVDS